MSQLAESGEFGQAGSLLVAAKVDPNDKWAQLRGLPRGARQRLVENLRKFDLVYAADQQKALRDLDRQVNDLDPGRRAHYLAALHRYHDWLDALPETKQDGLKQKALGERMELIKKLLKDHPVSGASTARLLQFVDVGDYSPFELAAIFQIWKSMSPDERQKVEKMQPIPRKSFLAREEAKLVEASLKRQGFDEAKWVADFETFGGNHKNAFPLQDPKSKQDARTGEILRRLAINFHLLKSRPKSVDPSRLDHFLASFPPWLQSSFDHYSPDEAIRRLTVVYRLVFPPGQEF